MCVSDECVLVQRLLKLAEGASDASCAAEERLRLCDGAGALWGGGLGGKSGAGVLGICNP